MTIPFEKIQQAAARGYTTSQNENKILDADLLDAISIEVYNLPENHLDGKPEAPLDEEQ